MERAARVTHRVRSSLGPPNGVCELTEHCAPTALGAGEQLCASLTNIWSETWIWNAFKGPVWLYLHVWQMFYHRGFGCVRLSDVEGLFDREDDVFDLRHAVVLQDFGVRHGDVDARHPGDRSVQVVEGGTWKHTQERLRFYVGVLEWSPSSLLIFHTTKRGRCMPKQNLSIKTFQVQPHIQVSH